MALRIIDIEGVEEADAKKLAEVGITTAETLLKEAGAPPGREALAQRTGLPVPFLLRLANRADLTRIKGIGGQYAELLEAAGVDTVKELKRAKATHLTVRLAEVNAERHLTRHVPTEPMVAMWIEEAKNRPSRVIC